MSIIITLLSSLGLALASLGGFIFEIPYELKVFHYRKPPSEASAKLPYDS